MVRGRIDNLVARFPPKKAVESKQQSVLDSLSPVDVDEFKLLFNFLDSDQDGLITQEDLKGECPLPLLCCLALVFIHCRCRCRCRCADKMGLEDARVKEMVRVASSMYARDCPLLRAHCTAVRPGKHAVSLDDFVRSFSVDSHSSPSQVCITWRPGFTVLPVA